MENEQKLDEIVIKLQEKMSDAYRKYAWETAEQTALANGIGLAIAEINSAFKKNYEFRPTVTLDDTYKGKKPLMYKVYISSLEKWKKPPAPII